MSFLLLGFDCRLHGLYESLKVLGLGLDPLILPFLIISLPSHIGAPLQNAMV